MKIQGFSIGLGLVDGRRLIAVSVITDGETINSFMDANFARIYGNLLLDLADQLDPPKKEQP